ncbi:MAG TPA: hypothetical protein VEY68_01850 [Anoxybacillus sp.]|jgi:hypothetical protein|nr:hypothetical protein [Anoxybacillus sp.]
MAVLHTSGDVWIIWSAIFSTQGTLFSELFPTKVRYTGLTVGYQFAA